MKIDNIQKAIETIKAYCMEVKEEDCDKCPISQFCTDNFEVLPEHWRLPWKDREGETIYKTLIHAVSEYRYINDQMPRRIYMSSYTREKMEDSLPRYVIGGTVVKNSCDDFCGVPIIEYEGNDFDFDIV